MEQLANNAASTLASSIGTTDTTITVQTGSVFPDSGNFRLLIDSELLLCTDRSGNTLTVTRGIESTSPANHAANASVTVVLTAGALAQYVSDNAGTSGALTAISQDTSPALGGNLSLAGHSIAGVTPTVFGYLVGITSDVQTQLTAKAATSSLAAVATSGAYSDLSGKPSLGTAAAKDTGSANGVASLDGSGKVPTSQLPASVVGDVQYQGAWNASTNSPTIPAASSSNKGWYYVVGTAGSTNVSGTTDWKVGDWLVSNGSTWDKIDNTDSVVSVAGLTGAIAASSLKSALSIAASDVSGLATVATTGAYSDLSGKPTILGHVSDDTSPALGGDLDTRDHAIKSGAYVAASAAISESQAFSAGGGSTPTTVDFIPPDPCQVSGCSGTFSLVRNGTTIGTFDLDVDLGVIAGLISGTHWQVQGISGTYNGFELYIDPSDPQASDSWSASGDCFDPDSNNQGPFSIGGGPGAAGSADQDEIITWTVAGSGGKYTITTRDGTTGEISLSTTDPAAMAAALNAAVSGSPLTSANLSVDTSTPNTYVWTLDYDGDLGGGAWTIDGSALANVEPVQVAGAVRLKWMSGDPGIATAPDTASMSNGDVCIYFDGTGLQVVAKDPNDGSIRTGTVSLS
ncbi:MAG TPA: hypothetical protein VG713_19210 [Pirellulales bacterium]|nr:hypothetical protein [Pirellulales bacterium]